MAAKSGGGGRSGRGGGGGGVFSGTRGGAAALGANIRSRPSANPINANVGDTFVTRSGLAFEVINRPGSRNARDLRPLFVRRTGRFIGGNNIPLTRTGIRNLDFVRVSRGELAVVANAGRRPSRG